MLQKVKKLLSYSTLKQIEWKSASKRTILLALIIFCIIQGGVFGMFAFGGIAYGIAQKDKPWASAGTGLIFLAALSGTSLRDPDTFWLFTLLLGAIVFAVIKKEGLLFAVGATLLIEEIAFLINFLPLHPIGFSAIIALCFLVVREVGEKAKNGTLGKEGVLKECLIFSIIMLLILGTTSWDL